MHQIDTPSNVAEAPAELTAMRNPGFWVSGNPQTGTLATTGDQDYHNALMMEAINTLLWAGLTSTKGQWTQVRDAIKAKLAAQFGAPVFFGTDTSAAANQITVNLSPQPANQAALAGALILIEVANTTTLQAVDIDADAFGNVPLAYPQGATLPPAGLVAAGSIIGVVYDPAPVNGNGGAPIYGLVGVFTSPPTTQRGFTYAGNPNGHMAGHAGNPAGLPTDRCFDTTDEVWWTCTATGNAAAAVWTQEGAPAGMLTDTGNVANAYIVARSATRLVGVPFQIKIPGGRGNTGNATINYGAGVISIASLKGGTNLPAGIMPAGAILTLLDDGANCRLMAGGGSVSGNAAANWLTVSNDGMIEQGGTISDSVDTSGTINFPIAFPNAVLSGEVWNDNNGNLADLQTWIAAGALAANSLGWYAANSGGAAVPNVFSWRVSGY